MSRKKKRILFIMLGAYPLFKSSGNMNYGGAEVDMHNIATTLSEDLFEIHFMVGDFGQPSLEKYEKLIIHRGPTIKNVGILGGMRNFFILVSRVISVNPDIIFTKGISWMTLELILIRIILGKKLIIRSSHKRNLDGTLNEKPYGRIIHFLINWIDVFILQNFEDSLVFKKTYAKFKRKLEIIRNFQNIPPYKERIFLKNILWIGRSEEVKQPEKFLELAKLLQDWKFTMIMPKTNPIFFDKIYQECAIIPNLEFIPGTPREQLDNYYSRATFLISTSKNEGFPNVILEAMKNGTPVISFLDFDGLIGKKSCGLISQNILEIKTYIKKIDFEKWKKLSLESHRIAQKNFDSKKISKEYEKIFSEI